MEQAAGRRRGVCEKGLNLGWLLKTRPTEQHDKQEEGLAVDPGQQLRPPESMRCWGSSCCSPACSSQV
ncbi:hypothetical protein Y1Q_0007747 [Alligator mississippiensis]|uniref:Uncharacterized protein n=1 Tax=Alligator mississippiensis TaxID=8496 RepID=A0A151NBX7_ALLMI|nr:hypothetical protein Y1Q_0007747 [Alligator mississippiensis]